MSYQRAITQGRDSLPFLVAYIGGSSIVSVQKNSKRAHLVEPEGLFALKYTCWIPHCILRQRCGICLTQKIKDMGGCPTTL